ncbi:Flp pilus assembly protein TadB [uncultured Avibacterium sp.]|uniref:Flp pilus assembly protein TadB n=1 Tax=uncultured Avibacterium sp. TaxID=1936169 RepID=A0A486XFH9_9PAST|nr:Flp pilus assembly protein TadB [uncultured Avibacterium sp.]
MTTKLLLIFLLLIFLSLFLLVVAIIMKRRYDYQAKIIHDVSDNNEEEQEAQPKKNKKQLELELVLINSSPVLSVLGMIDRNIRLKLLLMALLSGLVYIFNLSTPQKDLLVYYLLIGIFVILLPGVLTSMILNKKIKSIMTDLPSFIDLVAVSVQTGNSIEGGLRQVTADFKKLNPALTYVMTRIMRKAELSGLSSALKDLAVALPTTEIKMFCTVLQQSLNFGSSIYDQLIILSADIREIQLLQIEERLGTLAAKMSIPLILFIMFPIVILILAPGAMRVFPNVF